MMTSTTDISQADILKAVQDLRAELRADVATLKTKLAGQISTGLAATNLAIANLSDAHHSSIVAQEIRNAEFAGRDRVDELIARVHSHAKKVAGASLHLELITKQLEGLQTTIAKTDQRVDSNSLEQTTRMDNATISVLKGTLGYVLLTVITIAGAVAGFVVSHFIR